jgi:hypothetical protein
VLGAVDEAHAATAEEAVNAVAGKLSTDVEIPVQSSVSAVPEAPAGRRFESGRAPGFMLSRLAGGKRVEEESGLAGYVLEIVEGPEAGRTVTVENEAVELGREDGIGVQLAQDELVSRRHARLTPTADGVIVEDLESRNGTFVDGDEIFGRARLAPGGQLLVGVTLFELRSGAGAAPTAVRPVPSALSGPRPAPLAVEKRKPDYVPDDLVAGRRDVPLNPLLDVHTKSQARHAPLAIFVLVAVVVMIALALR